MKIQTKISPQLWLSLGKQQYKNHTAVIAIRELLQNSRDACIRANRPPDIRIVLDGKEPLTVQCVDNGCGMSELDVRDKLLQFGPVNDNKGAGDVGGFGIAKILLFGCYPWYLQTHDIYFDSDIFFSEGDSKQADYIDGTSVTLTVEKGLNQSDLLLAFGMVKFNNVPVQFTYNNQTETLHFTEDIKFHKETKLCRLYLSEPVTVFGQTLSGYAVYRLKGLVQFIEHKGFNGFNVIIDINADDLDAQSPNYPLTTSREALKGSEWWEIYSLLSDFKENPNTTAACLDDSENEVKLYEDKIFSAKRPKKAKKDKDSPDSDLLGSDQDEGDEPDEDCPVEPDDNSDQDCPDTPDGNQDKSEKLYQRRPGVGLPVIVKGRKEKPTVEEKRILRIWGEVVRLVTHDDLFGVGIVVSKHAAAARLEYGLNVYYLLNTSRLPDNLTKDGLILYLWTVATHESVHLWQSGHNETFTSKMIQLSAESCNLVAPALVKIKRFTARRL